MGGHHCSKKYGGLYCTTIFRIFAKRFSNFHNQRRVVISNLRNMADYQKKQTLKASKKARNKTKTTAARLLKRD